MQAWLTELENMGAMDLLLVGIIVAGIGLIVYDWQDRRRGQFHSKKVRKS